MGRELIQCRPKKNHPNQDWMNSWSLSTTPGLPSTLLSFLWRMTHDLLPCQTRLFRLQMPNMKSNICYLCNKNELDDLTHSLMTCPFNEHVGKFLLGALHHELPYLLPQVTRLEVEVAKDKQLPVAFLIASVFRYQYQYWYRNGWLSSISIGMNHKPGIGIGMKVQVGIGMALSCTTTPLGKI